MFVRAIFFYKKELHLTQRKKTVSLWLQQKTKYLFSIFLLALRATQKKRVFRLQPKKVLAWPPFWYLGYIFYGCFWCNTHQQLWYWAPGLRCVQQVCDSESTAPPFPSSPPPPNPCTYTFPIDLFLVV